MSRLHRNGAVTATRDRRPGWQAFCDVLECRQLLAVTPAEYESIRNTYPDFDLPADIAQVRIVEITPDQLNVANLRAAIDTAQSMPLSGLVVLRTTLTQNAITFSSSSDQIWLSGSSSSNPITLVGLGDSPLVLDTAQQGRLMWILGGSLVNLGGMQLLNGYASGGGALRVTGGTLTMADVVISGNSGGAVYAHSANLSLIDVSIRGNSGGSGAGIYQYGGTLMAKRVAIVDNVSGLDGGGLYQRQGTTSLDGVTISGNVTSMGYGGGIYAGGTLTLTNSVVAGNQASSGAGIYQKGDALTIVDSTICKNVSYAWAGGIYADLFVSIVNLDNTILAANYAGDGTEEDLTVASTAHVSATHSLVGIGAEPWLTDGVNGNIVGDWYRPADPMFVSMAGTDWRQWDLRLRSESPAVNSGSNLYVPPGLQTDIAGGPRIQGGTVDMGAYEFDSPLSVIAATINDGAAQRSMVNRVRVSFSEPVVLLPGALVLQKLNGSPVPGVWVTLTDLLGNQMTWELMFTVSGVAGASLLDGMYRVVATAAEIHDVPGNPMLADYSMRFHRLFGDTDGDRDVDSVDLATFKKALNRSADDSTYWYLDYDSNGTVSGNDYVQFRARLTRRILR